MTLRVRALPFGMALRLAAPCGPPTVGTLQVPSCSACSTTLISYETLPRMVWPLRSVPGSACSTNPSVSWIRHMPFGRSPPRLVRMFHAARFADSDEAGVPIRAPGRRVGCVPTAG